jgi:sialidase-1
MPSRVDDRDDQDRDDLPRRQKPKKQGSLAWLWILLGCGGLSVVACVVVGGIVAILFGTWSGSATLPPNPRIKQIPGLIAYWSFDEVKGDKIVDHSGRNNNLTLMGGGFDQGIRGKGLALNGQVNQWAEIPAGADFNFVADGPFAFAGWFKTPLNSACIVSLTGFQGPQQIDMLVRGNKFICVVGDDQDVDFKGNAFVWSNVLNDGQWHHFVINRQGAQIELWVDGVRQGSMAGAKSRGPITTTLRGVGSERGWITKNDQRWGNPSFEGVIDEVCVFNRALTPAEIQTLLEH